MSTEKQRVYIDASVISYLTARPSYDAMQAVQQAATEQWWREHRPQCDVFVSELADIEIARGDADAVRRRQESVATLVRWSITDEATALANRLLQAHVFPGNAKEDALHVALAAVHEMDILLA